MPHIKMTHRKRGQNPREAPGMATAPGPRPPDPPEFLSAPGALRHPEDPPGALGDDRGDPLLRLRRDACLRRAGLRLLDGGRPARPPGPGDRGPPPHPARPPRPGPPPPPP